VRVQPAHLLGIACWRLFCLCWGGAAAAVEEGVGRSEDCCAMAGACRRSLECCVCCLLVATCNIALSPCPVCLLLLTLLLQSVTPTVKKRHKQTPTTASWQHKRQLSTALWIPIYCQHAR
jgi:hypothetical protein